MLGQEGFEVAGKIHKSMHQSINSGLQSFLMIRTSLDDSTETLFSFHFWGCHLFRYALYLFSVRLNLRQSIFYLNI
jgi:hypothetical protein